MVSDRAAEAPETATVRTARLVLRPFREDDLEPLLLMHNDPEVMEFLTGGEPQSRQEVAQDLAGRFARRGFWVAVERDSGAWLGWFATSREPNRDPGDRELGYRLRRTAWGKGYATEGSLALIDHAFADPEVQRVWAETMAVNLRSRRVLEKCGMQHVRTAFPEWADPLPGSEQGEVEYALTRADWDRAR